MGRERIEAILRFWFGPSEDPAAVLEHGQPLWFASDSDFDRSVRDLFAEDLRRAEAGELDHWTGTPSGRLALLILLDQFTRNLYRNSGRAYAQDPRAQALVREGLAGNMDAELPPVRRVFFYMPLMHAEDLALQDESVRRFRDLAKSVEAPLRERVAGFLDYAERHRTVIRRFGRFPHRNAELGRESTPEELEFLKAGQRF